VHAGAIVALSLAASAAAAPRESPGLVIEQKTVHAVRSLVGMVTQEEVLTLSFSPAGLRIQAKGSQSPVIFRVEPDGRVIRIEVNGLAKTYRSEELAARRAGDAAIAHSLEDAARKSGAGEGGGMLEALAGLQGAVAEERRSREGLAVTTRALPGAREIAGRRCRGVEFLQGGEKVLEAWYTDSPAPAWLRRFDMEESPGAENRELAEARRRQPGIELESILTLPAGGRYEVRTTSVREEPVPPSALRPPAGFRDVSGGGTKGGAR